MYILCASVRKAAIGERQRWEKSQRWETADEASAPAVPFTLLRAGKVRR